jgi:hypothetical protein
LARPEVLKPVPGIKIKKEIPLSFITTHSVFQVWELALNMELPPILDSWGINVNYWEEQIFERNI